MQTNLNRESSADSLSSSGFEDLLTGGDAGEVSLENKFVHLWTVADAMKNLGVTKRTILRKLKASELKGFKVPGVYGDEWRIQNPADDTNVSPVALMSPVPNDSLVQELKARLILTEEKLDKANREIQAASFRNGYLEAQLQNKDDQIKLLTDTQRPPSKWRQFTNWLTGR